MFSARKFWESERESTPGGFHANGFHINQRIGFRYFKDPTPEITTEWISGKTTLLIQIANVGSRRIRSASSKTVAAFLSVCLSGLFCLLTTNLRKWAHHVASSQLFPGRAQRFTDAVRSSCFWAKPLKPVNTVLYHPTLLSFQPNPTTRIQIKAIFSRLIHPINPTKMPEKSAKIGQRNFDNVRHYTMDCMKPDWPMLYCTFLDHYLFWNINRT